MIVIQTERGDMPPTAQAEAGPSKGPKELFPEADVRREWSGICRVVSLSYSLSMTALYNTLNKPLQYLNS